MLQLKPGQLIRIAQNSWMGEYSEKEHTLYFKESLSKSVVAIYLRNFIEYSESMCKVIIGDKILYTPEENLREILDGKDNKICVYRGTNGFI